jgi:hypothetical protein
MACRACDLTADHQHRRELAGWKRPCARGPAVVLPGGEGFAAYRRPSRPDGRQASEAA